MGFRRTLNLYTILIILFCEVYLVTSSDTTNLQRLSRAHLEFALSVFRNLAQDSPISENVVISPHSIASVLSQLWLGAGDGSKTESQLQAILHYKNGGLSSEQVHEAFKSSLYTLEDPDYKNVVQTANAVFLQAGLSLNSYYEDVLKKFYNSSVDEVDFENGEIIARTIINRWVAQQTGGHISKLLESPLPSHTRLLLVNALALRALWNNSFDPALTIDNGHFHQSAKSKMSIPMMTGRFTVLLGQSNDLKCRLLELPFRGRRLSMFILLPDMDYGSGENRKSILTRLENKLTAENLRLLFSTLKEEKRVQVKIPRFRIRHSAPLVETLTKMGLVDMFDKSKSNFSKISDNNELYVSSISHKTLLEVREEGAQAAAATTTEIERNHNTEGKYFEVNRPFLFLIWDYHSGALLFIGRVASPEPLLT